MTGASLIICRECLRIHAEGQPFETVYPEGDCPRHAPMKAVKWTSLFESEVFPVFVPKHVDARAEAETLAAGVAKALNDGWDVIAVTRSIRAEAHLIVCRRVM